MKNKKGFTLIELLVVILIIGVLAGVGLPIYRKTMWKARFGTIKNIATAIKQAEEDYYLLNNSYTVDIEGLGVSFPTKVNYMTTNASSYKINDMDCVIGNYSSDQYVECFLDNKGSHFISYGRVFNKSPKFPGRQSCSSRSLRRRGRSICFRPYWRNKPFLLPPGA